MTVPKNDIPITRARRTEFATRAEGEEMIIEGYFVVFEQPYYVDDYCEEIIARGAFDGADMSDVRALIDHLPHLVIGRSTTGCGISEATITNFRNLMLE